MTRARRLSGFAAALAAVSVAPGTASARPSIATAPVSRMAEPWWQARFVAKRAALRAEPVDLLWLGDSITQDWEESGPPGWRDFTPAWHHFYDGRQAINLGFKGDSTCHLLWRLEHGELDGVHPRAAVLLIGANNFGHVHTDADETYAGIETILALLRARQPQMRVIVLGVLPSIRSSWVTANTDRLNTLLRERLTGRPGVDFVDAGAALERDGVVDPARFLDPHFQPPGKPLHPDAEAESAIAARIEPLVARDLGDKPRAPFTPGEHNE